MVVPSHVASLGKLRTNHSQVTYNKVETRQFPSFTPLAAVAPPLDTTYLYLSICPTSSTSECSFVVILLILVLTVWASFYTDGSLPYTSGDDTSMSNW